MLLDDLERTRPAYILDTSPGRYDYPYPPEQYPALARLLASDYRLETEIEGIRVFKRKDEGQKTERPQAETSVSPAGPTDRRLDVARALPRFVGP